MPSLSLHVLTMGEPGLRKALLSWKKVFPDLKIRLLVDPSNRKNLRTVEDLRPEIVEWKWRNDFGAARNVLLEGEDAMLVAWTDSDDELICPDPEAFRAFLTEHYDGTPVQFFIDYEYMQNDDGTPHMIQSRERIFSPHGYWQCPCHEVYITPSRADLRIISVGKELAYVKHEYLASDEDATSYRTMRNLQIMENYAKEGGRDRRLLRQLALAYVTVNKFEDAEYLYVELLKVEEDPASRSQVMVDLGELNLRRNDWRSAAELGWTSLTWFPSNRRAWRLIFDALCVGGEYVRALHVFDLAFGKKNMAADFSPVGNPTERLRVPYDNAARAAYAADAIKMALKFARKHKAETGDGTLLAEIQTAQQENKALAKEILAVRNGAAPSKHAHHPLIRRELLRRIPRRTQDTITIHCGFEGFGGAAGLTWGPESIKTGIGGSEEAVIRLSARLVRLGFGVDVVGPFETQLDEETGVLWIHHSEWYPEREENCFIAWRYTELLPFSRAKRTWLWCHDVMGGQQIEEMANCDAILVVSEVHRRYINMYLRRPIPVIVTANGIQDLGEVLPKRPGSIIYASSPDRGLLEILQWWPYIREKIPHATLDIYYGFNSWWRRSEDTNPRLFKMRVEIEALIEKYSDQGVVYHGNVGQPELHKAFASSQVWLYPTRFPEVFCITAIKAQALGCYPVTNTFWALAETVHKDVEPFEVDTDIPDALTFDVDAYIKRAVEVIVEGKTVPEHVQGWARAWTWDAVAKHWEDLYHGGRKDFPVARGGRLPE